MPESIEPDLLSNIYPLNKLSPDSLDQLQGGLRRFRLRAARPLFDIGDSPEELFYVLDGSVQMVNDTETDFTDVSPASGGESIPMPYITPSMHRAYALTDSQILGVDRALLDRIVRASSTPYDPARDLQRVTSARAAAERLEAGQAVQAPRAAAAGDWRGLMLAQPGYQRVPSPAMDLAFERMRPMRLRAADILVEQGEPADDFYVVAEGHCEVRVFYDGRRKSVKVNEYGPGGTVGEDALISNLPRNATVRASVDSIVMKLAGDDFRALIKPSLARPVDCEVAMHMVEHGAQWVDVRMPKQVHGERLREASAIPHPIIRSQLFCADRAVPYIVVCATLRDSPVIAYTLCKNGFDAYFLEGGFAAVPPAQRVPVA